MRRVPKERPGGGDEWEAAPRPPAHGPRPAELCEVVAMGSRTHHFAELAPAGTELAPARTVRPTEFCERVAMGLRSHHFADVACRAVPRTDPGRSRARRRSGEPTSGQRPTWTFDERRARTDLAQPLHPCRRSASVMRRSPRAQPPRRSLAVVCTSIHPW